MPLTFECPSFGGVGAIRLAKLSSRTRLRETLGFSIDIKNLVLGLDAILRIPPRVKASSSSIKHMGCAQSRYIRVLRGEKKTCFCCPLKNN